MNEKEMYDKILEDLVELTDLIKVLRPYDGEAPAALRNLARKKAAAVFRTVGILFPEDAAIPSVTVSGGPGKEKTDSGDSSTLTGISGTDFVPYDNEREDRLPEETPESEMPEAGISGKEIEEKTKENEGFSDHSTDNIPLEELLSRRLTKDLKKAISLNDWFRFKRELFGGNENLMNSTIAYLNGLGSFDEADGYIRKAFSWDMDSMAAQDFMKILEKRFS